MLTNIPILYLVIAGGVVLAAILFLVIRKKLRHTSMALLSNLTKQHHSSRVGGIVTTFLENAEFVRAMDTLIRRHKYTEAARIALLTGEEERAANLFLQGKDYEEAAKRFLNLGNISKAAEAFRIQKNWNKASEMYLKLGKPVIAAQMLLEAGDEDRAITILEQEASEYERLYVMALIWANKGEYGKSANAYFKAGHFQEAAQSFEQAGDYSRAAEAFLKANNPAKAARVMETAGKRKEAVKLYEKAGLFGEAARAASAKPITNSDVVRMANNGKLFEAGMEAFKQADYPLAERLMRALKPNDKGYHRSALILGKICSEDGRLEEAHNYLKAYLLYAPVKKDFLFAIKFALNFLEERGDLETCMKGLKRMEKMKMLNQELTEKLEQLKIRHAQNMMGNTVPLEAWVRKGSEPQVISIDEKQIADVLGTQFGIDKKLGDSGAVTVFQAFDKQNKSNYRIRVLHAWKMVVKPELKRIIEETMRLKTLKHPGIIPGTGGMLDKAPYVITQEPSGLLLKDIIEKRKSPFSIQETIKIASGVALAIDHAHKERFVHKGLSPSCIYVSNNGNTQVDCFGIPDIRFDKQGPILWGDIAFLSPEAKQGRPITPASDIYSFALVILNMLLGKLAYKSGAPSIDIEYSIIEIRKHRNDISLGLLALLKMSLSSEPSERPRQANALVKELSIPLKQRN